MIRKKPNHRDLTAAVERIDPNGPDRHAFLKEVAERQRRAMQSNPYILSAKAVDIHLNKRASSFSEALAMVTQEWYIKRTSGPCRSL